MAVVNTYFQKREEHGVTYKSGGRRTQVDYILCRRGNMKEISDCKVVVGESVAREHRMVVCRMTLMVCKKKMSKMEKKTKWWKLKKEECCEEFKQKLRQALDGQEVLPDDWETTAEVIRETERKVLGVSYGRRKEDKETWWWNEEVQDSIQRKRLAKKKWDMDRTEENRQEYKELQRRVKRKVSKAKQKAYDELYTRLDTREGEKDLYRIARQRDRDGKDVQQVRVKDRDGRVLTSEESVQRRWKEYFEELMNEENDREKRVEGVNSVEQKVDKIRKDEVRKALKRMQSGKAVGPDDIPVEYEEVRSSREVCQVVQDMYERRRTVVRYAVGQTEEFKVEVGLQQGSALSPFLFAMVMDQLSEEWEQVEENLERWRFALERRGMKVSRSKTEYMCVNEREGSGTVRLQGEEVKKVQEFKYLGSTVQINGECGKEVKKRVQAGWNGWRKVLGVLCDRKISARIKGKVYRTVVRMAMLYGLETVSLRKRQESELEVAELKMLRCSLGVTRLDRIRNEYIRGTAHVGRLGDKVRESRLRWFGHVQRRESEYIGRRMLDMELPGRRQRGRPKRRYMDGINEDMMLVGASVEDAEDRDSWREMIRWMSRFRGYAFREGDIVSFGLRSAISCPNQNCLWPKSVDGFVYVPYTISPLYDNMDRITIEMGMLDISSSTCVKFVPRTHQADFVDIQPRFGCWSFLGRVGGPQPLSLQTPGCMWSGVASHELMHVLGFVHEQSRSDRDHYVNILWENIIEGQKHNFKKYETNNLNTVYDYDSVMHYG
ncbi:hypothetical protein QTP86_021378, partial [Hemibagrus guttatus]